MKRMEENKLKYFVINCVASDWKFHLQKCSSITYIDRKPELPKKSNVKIIPLLLEDRYLNEKDDRMIFKMDISFVKILENKCKFANYMMTHFPENIPKVISIKTNRINYIDPEYKNDIDKGYLNRKMIKKNALGYAGNGTSIIYSLEERKNNCVVSDYIEHNDFYSGHFLILKGEIIKSIFFKSSTGNNPNYIQRGRVTKYEILEADKIDGDLTTFDKIFKRFNYSGFACPDFIIVDKKVIIFEINPRPGGSFIANGFYRDLFFQTIIDMQISD
jgi:hypothetical protein